MMGKVTSWLFGKLLDRLWDWITVISVGSVFAFVASLYSIFGLWRTVGIGCFAGIATLGVIQIYRQENGTQKNNRKLIKEMESKIASLDQAEIDIVSAFSDLRLNTLEFAINDPVIAGLESKGILVRASKGVQKGNMSI